VESALTTVVTGASGHVGANLVRELLARGRKVRALTLPGDTNGLEELDVELVEGDVRNAEDLIGVFQDAHVVFHLAGVISIDGGRRGLVRSVNVGGAATVARTALACGVRRLVHTSSIHALDPFPEDEPLDESRAAVGSHGSAYDRSKADGEASVRAAVAEGLDAVIVNPTGVIGPNDFRPSRMGGFFLDLALGRLPALLEGGFNWVDARDVARGLLLAEEKGHAGERYILGGERWVALTELGALAAALTGTPPPAMVTPAWIARPLARLVSWPQRLWGGEPVFTPESVAALRLHRFVSIEKAKRELGYKPRPIEETVRDVYADFCRRGLVSMRPARGSGFATAVDA
jgi:dihydroflavonol-4-reductase